MKFNLKNVISVLLLMVVVSPLCAAPTAKSFIIATNSAGSNSVVGTIYYESEFNQVAMSFKSGAALSDTAKPLGSYYTAAFLNDVKVMPSIFYDADNSRRWLKEELVSIPDKFEGFKRLDKVLIKNQYYWGDYSVWDVSWFLAGDKLAAKWNEASICTIPDKCYMSNLLLNGSEESSIFTRVMYQLQKGAQSASVGLPYTVEYLPASGQDKYPLRVAFSLKWYEKNRVSVSSTESKTEAFGDEAQVLFGFVRQLWSSKVGVPKAMEGRLSEIYSQYWKAFSPEKLFPAYTPQGTQKIVHYPPSVLAGKIYNAKKMTLIAKLSAGDEDYLISLANGSEGNFIVIFPYSKASKMLTQITENQLLFELVYSTSFNKTLAREIEKELGIKL